MKLSNLIDEVVGIRWSQTLSGASSARNARACCALLGDPEASEVSYKLLCDLRTKFRSAGLAEATVNRHLSAVQTCLREGLRLGHLSRLPAIPARGKEKGRDRVLAKDEVTELTSKMTLVHSRLTWFLFDTGLRVSEALNLKVEDLTDDDCVLVRTLKGGPPRVVPLTARAKQQVVVRGGGIFQTTQDSYNGAWSRAKSRSSLRKDPQVVPHALRHSAASRLVSNGADIFLVKEFLGHRDIKTTVRYSHLAPSRLRAVTGFLGADK